MRAAPRSRRAEAPSGRRRSEPRPGGRGVAPRAVSIAATAGSSSRKRSTRGRGSERPVRAVGGRDADRRAASTCGSAGAHVVPATTRRCDARTRSRRSCRADSRGGGLVGGQRATPAGAERGERGFPGAFARRPRCRRMARRRAGGRVGGQPGDGVGQRAGARRAQHARAAGGDQLAPGRRRRPRRPAARRPAPPAPPARRCRSASRRGRGRRPRTRAPARRPRASRETSRAEPSRARSASSSGPPPASSSSQPRVARPRGEERVGEQVDALLLREPAGVEHADAAVGRAGAQCGREAGRASTPRSQRPIARGVDAERAQPARRRPRTGESTASQPP